MSSYFEFTETSQDMTSQDSSQHKPMDIYGEDNEYYEDEVEDATNLEEGDEEEEGDAWDDSALIAAWDIAVKEYQDFHSIKANKTDTKGDKKISTFSSNKVMETEKSVNIIKEDEVESFMQQDISHASDENGGTSSSVMNISVKEQKQNVQKLPEQKIKETRQIKPQTGTKSIPILTKDTSYQPQPIRTTTTYSSYSHQFPGYYSYPPPSSSTAPIPPHSFGEQTKGTTDTQEDQEEESQLPPTEEATTSYSNTNSAHDPYYSYGWYPNYYPPPPPPPPPPPGSQQPIPPPQFYSSMPTDPNTPFPGWRPKPPDMAPPMPGFDDEALTNLIMAWYYSGYYTGLYHGRKGR
uniref:Component of gems protein 1 n=1 Tax=Anthurium amnicola TaxID=1678845 RepID=A0A1D1YHJ5_9ARAE